MGGCDENQSSSRLLFRNRKDQFRYRIRATYQNSEGTTGNLGSSIVACPSYRISGGNLQFLPTVSMANVETGLLSSEGIKTTLLANFGSKAAVASIRTYPEPAVGLTCTSVRVKIDVRQSISLDTNQLGNDVFRFLTVSSMFSNRTAYDANVIKWEAPTGKVKMFRLRNNTPRDTHLLAPGRRWDVGLSWSRRRVQLGFRTVQAYESKLWIARMSINRSEYKVF